MKTLKLIGEYLFTGIFSLYFICCLILMASTDSNMCLLGVVLMTGMILIGLIAEFAIMIFERRHRRR